MIENWIGQYESANTEKFKEKHIYNWASERQFLSEVQWIFFLGGGDLHVHTNVSEEHTVSIFRAEGQLKHNSSDLILNLMLLLQ